MRGGEGETVPVDLVEVDGLDAPSPNPGGDGYDGVTEPTEPLGDHPAAVPAGHRRRRRVLVAVSAGVVLALAATGGVLTALDSRRAEARWDALAERGWPLVDLDSPLEQVWRAGGGGWPIVATPEVIVVEGQSSTAAPTWRALDVATGEVLWERASQGTGWCTGWNPQWPEPDVGSSPYGAAVGAIGLIARADPTLLVCSDTSVGGELPSPGATSVLRAVDLASGREVGAVTVEGGLLSLDLVGDDLIVATVAADGAIDVTRVGLLSGGEVWTEATEIVAVDEEGMLLGTWLQVIDGAVVLTSSDGDVTVALDADTGERVPTPPLLQTADGGWVRLADGSRALIDYGLTSSGDGSGSYLVGEPSVTVAGPDGQERFSAAGELWSPWVTDGSMADRIAVTRPADSGGTELVALDVVTGEELWTSPAAWSSTILQVDGVVVSGSGYLSATDLRTGEELWERRGSTFGAVSPVTDGSRLAVPIGEDGATWLVAIDIRSGAEAWRVPLVPIVELVTVVDGGVLVGSDSELVFYR